MRNDKFFEYKRKIYPNIKIYICLLRMIMCFCVLLYHFGGDYHGQYKIFNIFYIIRGEAVPVFMIISFYLFAEMVLGSCELKKMKDRMMRLIFPQVVWAIIYFIIYKMLFVTRLYDTDVQVFDLIWQCFTGTSPELNATMWFQTDLIVLTLIFFLVLSLIKKQDIIIITLNIFLLLALILQYSGINIYWFNDMRDELKYPLGRFFEMLPYAVIGVDLNIIYKIFNNNIIKKCILCVIVAVLFVLSGHYQNILSCAGYAYQGVYCIILAVLIFILFSVIPFDKLPCKVKLFLINASKYTLGIYCMHRLVERLIAVILLQYGFVAGSEIYGFTFCVILYVICFMLAHIIYLIPNRYVKQIVS